MLKSFAYLLMFQNRKSQPKIIKQVIKLIIKQNKWVASLKALDAISNQIQTNSCHPPLDEHCHNAPERVAHQTTKLLFSLPGSQKCGLEIPVLEDLGTQGRKVLEQLEKFSAVY
jgi:hypothetical protein